METFYKPPFRKFVKKQARPLQLSIEDEIEKILENPALGETKKGDLQGFRVHKFPFKKQRLLIAYKVLVNEILFYMVEPRENFYRNLKKYLKEGY
jgi:mRNA-degrading endonuclease RelE of RelBE toxin-antitoxin system